MYLHLLNKKKGFGLCWAGDVFGEHSKGETAAGLCFHGEAGLSTWEVEAADKAAGVLVMYVLFRILVGPSVGLSAYCWVLNRTSHP